MLDFGLPKQTIDCLIEYFKSKPAIDKVLIFGSRAKGNFRNYRGRRWVHNCAEKIQSGATFNPKTRCF